MQIIEMNAEAGAELKTENDVNIANRIALTCVVDRRLLVVLPL